MEILTKRPFWRSTFSLNSTLGLFTSLQCIQNTLLVAASSQTNRQVNMADFGPCLGREKKEENGCPWIRNQLPTSNASSQIICVYLRKCLTTVSEEVKVVFFLFKITLNKHSQIYTSAFRVKWQDVDLRFMVEGRGRYFGSNQQTGVQTYSHQH